MFDEKLKPVKNGKRDVFNAGDFEIFLKEELSKFENNGVSLIGHRVVHGADKFIKPVKITDSVLEGLEKLNSLAPLHNPYNMLGIRASRVMFKDVPQFAVFDTEFFADLPEKAFTYALPEKIAREFGFRRYGFHGISHEYVARKSSELLKKPFEKLKIITCHLGGGSSVAAIKNGKAVDTSMGFTPLEGAVMMTRPGNIDAGVVLELVKNFSAKTAEEILNYKSGLKGICGMGNMLEVLYEAKDGDKKAQLALEVFVYSIQKYIGSYFAILGGCDILVFTGSIGSGSVKIKNMICPAAAGSRSRRDGSMNIFKKTKILQIETDEELAIAQKIKNN